MFCKFKGLGFGAARWLFITFDIRRREGAKQRRGTARGGPGSLGNKQGFWTHSFRIGLSTPYVGSLCYCNESLRSTLRRWPLPFGQCCGRSVEESGETSRGCRSRGQRKCKCKSSFGTLWPMWPRLSDGPKPQTLNPTLEHLEPPKCSSTQDLKTLEGVAAFMPFTSSSQIPKPLAVALRKGAPT